MQAPVMDAAAALEAARKQHEEASLPPLPPLLAQILAQARAKQQAAKDGTPLAEGEPGEGSDDEAKAHSGPLLLEGPSCGLIMQGSAVPERRPGEESDSDSDAEPEAPLGPLDASRSRVHGPGFSGGAACQPVKLTITARDSNGKRIREGGAHVLVMVEPPPPPPGPAGEQAEEPEAIQADVVDHGDGTYTATYAVPTKGNYQLHIEVNGEPVGDSPYPLFFSAPVAPKEGAPAAPAAANVPGMPEGGGPLPPSITTVAGIQVVTADALRGLQGGDVTVAAPVPLGVPMPTSLGAELARMGIRFPPTPPEQLARMVMVGGVTPSAKAEELKGVFAAHGRVRNCSLAGCFAFVEFERSKHAAAALAAAGQQFMGAPLRVELAANAKAAADAAFAASTQALNPYAALQAAQVQQFQLMQQQQTALAEQVAAMRASQRTGVSLEAMLVQQGITETAAAAAAAAPPVAAGKGERRRSRSRSRGDRRRRSRSRDRERRRSRSRGDRRRRSRSRDRVRSSRRSRSLDRSDRRDCSRDRGDRRRRSRSRDRGHKHHHKHRHHHREKGSEGVKPQPMDVDAAAAAAAQQPKDDLEALLEEFEG